MKNSLSIKVFRIELSNTLGKDKRYHAYLCQLFNRVVNLQEVVGKHYVLRLVVKAVINSLTQTSLFWRYIFGVLLSFSVQARYFSFEWVQFHAIAIARDEKIKLVALLYPIKAQKTNVLSAADLIVCISDKVLLNWANEKLWIGFYTMINALVKAVFLISIGKNSHSYK